MSSSNRGRPVAHYGTLICNDQAAGPMRFPENRMEEFVDLFNRTYQTLGLSVHLLPAGDHQKSPASPLGNAGDRV